MPIAPVKLNVSSTPGMNLMRREANVPMNAIIDGNKM